MTEETGHRTLWHRIAADYRDEHGREPRQPLLDWVQPMPDVWVSTGTSTTYILVRSVLPQRDMPKESFDIRKIHGEFAKPYSDDLGYFAGHALTLRLAKAEAERMAWRDLQGGAGDVPADEPALDLERFFWPISDGTNRAALAVVVEDGRVLARVLGRCRSVDDTYETTTCVEIDVSDAVAGNPAPRWSWFKTLAWLLLGRPRWSGPGCGPVNIVAPVHPHDPHERGR